MCLGRVTFQIGHKRTQMRQMTQTTQMKQIIEITPKPSSKLGLTTRDMGSWGAMNSAMASRPLAAPAFRQWTSRMLRQGLTRMDGRACHARTVHLVPRLWWPSSCAPQGATQRPRVTWRRCIVEANPVCSLHPRKEAYKELYKVKGLHKGDSVSESIHSCPNQGTL